MSDVLHIITRLDRGGSAEVALDLAAGLRERGYRQRLITGYTRHPQEDIAAFEERSGVPVTVLSSLRREVWPWNDAAALFQLVRLMLKWKPRLVHTHTSKAGTLGRIAAWLTRRPVVVHTPHGHVFYGYFSKPISVFFTVVERALAKTADRITTLTDMGRLDHLGLHIGRPEQLQVISPGVHVERFAEIHQVRESMRKKLGFGDERVVGWVGRLTEIKDCATFLAAAAEVAAALPTAGFLVVGDGDLRESLEAQAERLGLSDRVRFMGHREDVPALMSAMDLFVLSSLNEGFGRVLVEAMAAGLPIVATLVGGVPEVVRHGETGLLVPAGEPAAMAEAVLAILQDMTMARRLWEAGRREAAAHSVERMVSDFDELYQSLGIQPGTGERE